jgi:hypothetical protein
MGEEGYVERESSCSDGIRNENETAFLSKESRRLLLTDGQEVSYAQKQENTGFFQQRYDGLACVESCGKLY